MADEDNLARPAAAFWSILASCAATLGVALTIFMGVGWLTIAPRDASIDALGKSIDRINIVMAPLLTLNAQHASDEEKFAVLRAVVDDKMNKDVHAEFAQMITGRINALVSTNDSALAEISHQVHDLEGNIVTRQENIFHWNTVDALALRVNALSDRQCGPASSPALGTK